MISPFPADFFQNLTSSFSFPFRESRRLLLFFSPDLFDTFYRTKIFPVPLLDSEHIPPGFSSLILFRVFFLRRSPRRFFFFFFTSRNLFPPDPTPLWTTRTMRTRRTLPPFPRNVLPLSPHFLHSDAGSVNRDGRNLFFPDLVITPSLTQQLRDSFILFNHLFPVFSLFEYRSLCFPSGLWPVLKS